MRKRIGWGFSFVLAAAVAPTLWVMRANVMVAHFLTPWGVKVPALNLVWVGAGLPVTFALLLVGGILRPPRSWWLWLGGFFLGIGIEAVTKHLVATPMPHPTPEPALYARLERMTNITPQTVKHWLAAGLPTARAVQAVAGSWVRGSFPSGHTFRATYVTEALAPRSPVVRWLVPLAVAAAVVATGGHWPWDTVGGWLLAQTLNPRARRRA